MTGSREAADGSLEYHGSIAKPHFSRNWKGCATMGALFSPSWSGQCERWREKKKEEVRKRRERKRERERRVVVRNEDEERTKLKMGEGRGKEGDRRSKKEDKRDYRGRLRRWPKGKFWLVGGILSWLEILPLLLDRRADAASCYTRGKMDCHARGILWRVASATTEFLHNPRHLSFHVYCCLRFCRLLEMPMSSFHRGIQKARRLAGHGEHRKVAPETRNLFSCFRDDSFSMISKINDDQWITLTFQILISEYFHF